MIFRSDNSYGVPPAILEAVAAANGGAVPSYGDDALTARVEQRFRELFECDVEVALVATGTAANSIGLSAVTPPFGIIYCHGESHIHLEEAGAPGFFTGGAQMHALPGFAGKIDPAGLKDALSHMHRSVHELVPATLSLTQATECGTLYSLDEIAALTDIARSEGMAVHMDGARFANALATLDCSPADATWRAGIDILSFGATKNGAMAAEAVVVFDRDKARDLMRRRKRAGHLWSKMRFLSAQMDAYLADELWLRLARDANAAAARLASGIEAAQGCRLPWPTQANEVFVVMQRPLAERLEAAGIRFHGWTTVGLAGTNHALSESETFIRLVTSFATPDADIDGFLSELLREAA